MRVERRFLWKGQLLSFLSFVFCHHLWLSIEYDHFLFWQSLVPWFLTLSPSNNSVPDSCLQEYELHLSNKIKQSNHSIRLILYLMLEMFLWSSLYFVVWVADVQCIMISRCCARDAFDYLGFLVKPWWFVSWSDSNYCFSSAAFIA